MHALAFRVMRLSQPELAAEQTLSMDVALDMLADGEACTSSPSNIDVRSELPGPGCLHHYDAGTIPL